MFKTGQRKARKILKATIGKKEGNALWNIIRWSFTEGLPKDIQKEYPNFAWMGFCCPMTDGSNSIIINPEHHKNSDEVALTIGHELAHALQNVVKGAGNANHDDEIFQCFRKAFCEALEYESESF